MGPFNKLQMGKFQAARRHFSRLSRDRKGAVAMIIAMSTPIIVGGLGVSVDTIQWSLTKRQLQRQADSAAIAGAYGMAQGLSAVSVARNDLDRNALTAMTEAAVIENAPTAGPQAGNNRAVRVVVATLMDLPFTRIFIDDPVRIETEATASMVANGEFCALSLENQNAVGINMTGNTTVDLSCGMATNSVSATAVTAGGSSQVTATPIAAVGGLQPSTHYVGATELIPYSVPQPDPFIGLPTPTGYSSSNNGNVNSNQTRTLNPGAYRGMTLQGNVTLNPGVYIVDAGDFTVGSQARVTGNGVVIILTASNPNQIGQVKINGGAQLNMSAPTSGPYAGVLMYQDRRATLSNQTNKINGNSASSFQGAFYFPGQEMEFSGTSGMNIDCIQMVARRMTFIGNSTVRNICPPGSGAGSFTGTAVRLVG